MKKIIIIVLLLILLLMLLILVIQIYKKEKEFSEVIYKNKKLVKKFNKILFLQELYFVIVSIIFIVMTFYYF